VSEKDYYYYLEGTKMQKKKQKKMKTTRKERRVCEPKYNNTQHPPEKNKWNMK
jgi:hypothetical protein